MNRHPVDPRSDLGRPRRVAVAVALFLLFAAVPVVIGGVTETDAAPVGDLPATFQTAPPHEGDHVVYEVGTFARAGDSLRLVRAPEDLLGFTHAFHWLPVEGSWERFHEVKKVMPDLCFINDQESAGYRSSLFAANGTSVGHGEGCDNSARPVEENPEGWGKRVLVQSTRELRLVGPGTVGGAHECLHRHGFQGVAFPLDALDHLFPECFFALTDATGTLRGVGTDRIVFEAVGMVGFGDERALVVQGTQDGLVDPITVQWWFVSSVPYPVRVVLEIPTQDHLEVYDLVRLHRGLPPASAPTGPEPALPTRPWGSTGPAEMDIEHPFPLSAALRVAAEEPAFEDFHAYRSAHPDAVVQWAEYVHSEGEPQTHTWWFTMSDGTDQAAFTVDKVVSRPNLGVLGHRLGLDAPEDPPEYRFSTTLIEGPQWYAPGDLPSAPTVPALTGLYRTLAGKEANAWGMRTCTGSCEGPGILLTVGRSHAQSTPQWETTDIFYPSGQENQQVHDLLVLDAQGSFVAWEQRSLMDHYGPNAAVPPTETRDIDGSATLLTSEAVVVWRVPAAVATGSILVALVVAVGYWLWPLAKLSPMALFSRIQRDRLLENPHRQAIQQAIEAAPGIHHRELMRTLDLPEGTLKHHLDKLLEGGLVSASSGPGYTCYFLRGKYDRRTMEAAAVLKSPVARALLDATQQGPPLTPTEAARRFGVKPPTILHHAARLERAGLLRRVKASGVVRLESVNPDRVYNEDQKDGSPA